LQCATSSQPDSQIRNNKVKMYFFEKKNQKTFIPLRYACSNERIQGNKRFLLLFFKKEVLPVNVEMIRIWLPDQ